MQGVYVYDTTGKKYLDWTSEAVPWIRTSPFWGRSGLIWLSDWNVHMERTSKNKEDLMLLHVLNNQVSQCVWPVFVIDMYVDEQNEYGPMVNGKIALCHWRPFHLEFNNYPILITPSVDHHLDCLNQSSFSSFSSDVCCLQTPSCK